MSVRFLDPPEVGEEVGWARAHLADLTRDPLDAAPIRGGYSAAQEALDTFNVRGYARLRNNVWPESSRGASGLSPYIRHGLLQLSEVWSAVEGGPAEDVARFRDELLWQEYARHLYARLGRATGHSLRFVVADRTMSDRASLGDNPWNTDVPCVARTWSELTESGWITNQQRMWLASHWGVRAGLGWRDGEDLFFRHLLDGSRAANRVGWQWTVGALTGKPYGFSRWQVEKRAPGLCDGCPLNARCPIENWPPDVPADPRTVVDPRVRADPDLETTRGPRTAKVRASPSAVWITAESLGDSDPALQAHPDLPVIFVFDAPLLQRVRVSGRRLIFLVEALSDLATRRHLRVVVGDPFTALTDQSVAVTFAPVPGFRDRAAALEPSVVHPYPWLVEPHAGPLTSFTAWLRASERRRRR